MIKYINEVTRQFGIEHHILRNWEEKGLLGVVERDFTHGRMYDEEQLRRIQCIRDVVKKQQEKGMKRTDFREVERVLLEEFGGVIEERPPSVPMAPETFTNMLVKMNNQEKEMQRLQQMMMDLTKVTAEQLQHMNAELTKSREENETLKQYLGEKLDQRELPAPPVDYTKEMQRIIAELTEARAKEEERQQTSVEIHQRLQQPVELISTTEEKKENEKTKAGFFRKLFG